MDKIYRKIFCGTLLGYVQLRLCPGRSSSLCQVHPIHNLKLLPASTCVYYMCQHVCILHVLAHVYCTRASMCVYYMCQTTIQKHAPRGQFQWVQMAPTDHSGCIPPRSNQYPLRSSHLEPPEPPMAINARFMAFSGSLWPLNRHKRPNVDVPKLDLHPT